jgi:ankyrin repeat protein
MAITSAKQNRDMSIKTIIFRGGCPLYLDSQPMFGENPDTDGNMQLHRAIEDFSMDCMMGDMQSLENTIIAMIHQSPNVVRVLNNRGFAPLHLACRHGVTLPIIHALVQAWPESIRIPTINKQSRLPLHILCRNYSGPLERLVKILEYFLSLDPSAVRIPTLHGDLPLHLYCRNSFCTLPVVQKLLKAFPEAAEIVNRHKQLPIHIACEHQYVGRLQQKHKKRRQSNESHDTCESKFMDTSCQVIRYLASTYPQSLAVVDDSGELALHKAVRAYQSVSTLEILLLFYPEAMEAQDNQGRTPLHIALQRRIPNVDSIDFLVREVSSARVSVNTHIMPIEESTQSLKPFYRLT